MQIELTADGGTGQGRLDSADGRVPLPAFEGEQELLDDFLSRLQSIIRLAPAASPASMDETLPTRFPRRRS